MLPDHCETEMLFSKGVIMDNKEMECPFPNIVCVFLPQIPDVRIKTFKMKEHCIVQETAEYQEIISTIVNHKTSMSNHETSTCFMLFCNDHGHTTAKCWASAMQKRYDLYLIQTIIHIQILYYSISNYSQVLQRILDNICLFFFACIQQRKHCFRMGWCIARHLHTSYR